MLGCRGAVRGGAEGAEGAVRGVRRVHRGGGGGAEGAGGVGAADPDGNRSNSILVKQLVGEG